MLRFGDAYWIDAAWLILGLAIVAWFFESFLFAKIKKSFGEKIGMFLSQSLSFVKRRWHLILQTLSLICFAFALARPLLGSKQTEIKQRGLELILAVDVSNSMLAEDDKPSRLEHAKHELSQLLDLLGGNRVGLVAFAGSAVLVSPMTTDASAIRLYLNSLSPDSVSTQGTNFKAVLEEAMRAFNEGGVEGLNGEKPTRVLLFATDGEDNEAGVDSVIKKALDQGVRIFALGFGSARGGPIPIRDDRGTLKGYKLDSSKQPVMSMPNDKILADLARKGGGAYYHATFEQSELRQLVQDLDKLEKADFKSRLSAEYDEKFQIPLFVGLLLTLIDLSFGDRKSRVRPWRGRFEVSP